MKSAFVVFIGLFSLIYGGASYYVGSRFLESLRGMGGLSPYSFWMFFAVLSWSPFAARIGSARAGLRVPKGLIRLGDYWMAALYYLFLGWIIVDVVRLLAQVIPFLEPRLAAPSPLVALAMVAFLLLLLAVGTIKARQTKVARYQISLPRPGAKASTLKAVMVSDVHLGRTIGVNRLRQLVQQINALRPDVIFLPGDIIDGDVEYYESRGMDGILAGLQAEHGVFAVLGNHEYLGGSGTAAAEQLQRAGVTVLRDQCVNVPGLFNVAGRDDRMSARFTGTPRLPLPDILSGSDRSLPTILLDHQPYDLHEASEQGVDLQLSGHTHNGQFFPNNLITGHIFEQDWGYLKKDYMHLVVSCGYGTWGPPIRLGSHSEIVLLELTLGPV
ncbi:MAG TPA: metallophosphoesterase [Bacillota bacterium]|nr:metallophosphoesterase [Bacillota bacterium]